MAQNTAQHTPSHIDCPACAIERQRALMLFAPDVLFEAAAEAFYSYRELDAPTGIEYVRPNTLAAYRRQIESLKLFFTGMRLADVHWYNMKAYQKARAIGAEPFVRFRRPQDRYPRRLSDGTVLPPIGKTACPARPQQINQETALLKRIKFLAGCWTEEDKRLFQPLLEPEAEVPRALTPAQQSLWLDVARSDPKTEIVYLYSLVAFDTLCSPNELRMLRIGDLKLHYDMISVPWPAAKNKHRHREIAGLQPETHWALEQLIARSLSLVGAADSALCPMHCLFPAMERRRKGVYNPLVPMSSSGLKKPWETVRLRSGIPWFRIEDTRHTGATRMAEDGKPGDVISARMGHVRPEMRLHYTHISSAAQRSWMKKPPLSVAHFDSRVARFSTGTGNFN